MQKIPPVRRRAFQCLRRRTRRVRGMRVFFVKKLRLPLRRDGFRGRAREFFLKNPLKII
jgi:hypothetical protein